MKLKLPYSVALAWMEAFAKVKTLPEGAKVELEGAEYKFAHVLDDPHPPSVWLRGRKGNRAIRFGDPAIHELRSLL